MIDSQDYLTVNLAIGRIWGMMQRPEQAGDVAEYERCRLLILNIADPDDSISITTRDRIHDYGRDRLKGAQGDM